MNGEQIIQEIVRYINDNIYNYAVLIDGEWGCGKTYFVKNELKPAIENLEGKSLKVKMVSLYGCKTVDDVQENLIWELAEEAKQAHKKSKDKPEKTGKQENDVIDSSISSTRKIIGGLIKRFFPNTSIYDIAWEWLKPRSYVIIFDDLERCDCSLNEIFGFINGLVEHEGIKVIIVANEKEIYAEKIPERVEQQYMVALSDGINWPQYKNDSLYTYLKSDKDKKNISLDELEYRRKSLFSNFDFDRDYRRIREKIIGITLYYEPNMSEITQTLVNETGYSTDIQEAIMRNIMYIEERMNYYQHHNLRTIQFFLSRTCQLLKWLRSVQYDTEYKEKIENYVIRECFVSAVEFKSGYISPPNEFAYISETAEKSRLITIREYVEYGKFEESLFENDIRGLESLFKAKIDSDDPYNKLNNEYFLMTQKECEKTLLEMINRLEKNSYPAFIYEKILIIIGKLVILGFDDKYADRTKNAIINNCKTENISSEIIVDRYFIEDEKIYQKVNEYLFEINEAIKNNAKQKKERTIYEILNAKDWSEGLNTLFSSNRNNLDDLPVFIQIDASEWIKAIVNSSAREIHQFRFWMWKIYPQSIARKSFLTDWPTLLKIHDAVLPNKESDLLRKYALELLKWQIEEEYRINTGQQYVEKIDENKTC